MPISLPAALLIQLCKCNPRRVTPFELGKFENSCRIHAFPAGAGNTRGRGHFVAQDFKNSVPLV